MILFVDDEPFFVDAYKEELEADGYKVSIVKSIAIAMKRLEENPREIDLVILDVMMTHPKPPREDSTGEADLTAGFWFYDWIRERLPGLPVIVLTNKTTSDVDRKFSSEENCALFRKGPQCPAFALVAQVRSMTERKI